MEKTGTLKTGKTAKARLMENVLPCKQMEDGEILLALLRWNLPAWKSKFCTSTSSRSENLNKSEPTTSDWFITNTRAL